MYSFPKRHRVPAHQPRTGLNPLRYAGCKLWFRADRGVVADSTGAVSSWADQVSGHVASQVTSGHLPFWARSGTFPALLFDGVDDELSLDTTLTLSGDITIFATGWRWSSSKMFLPIGGPSSGWSSVIHYSDQRLYFQFDSTSGYGQADASEQSATPHVYMWMRSGSTCSFAIDSTMYADSSAGSDDLKIDRVGARATSGLRTSGAIQEILVYNSALSAVDHQHVRRGLAIRAGIIA